MGYKINEQLVTIYPHKPMKKLFLLDAMALIYRSHFAFVKNPRINSKGINTSAVFGFTNTLLDLLNSEKPTHLAVVFDTPAPTFRHIRYPEYKAQRDAQPEDITIAIPYIKKLCKNMNIAVVELDGFEADDLIGTLAKEAVKDTDFTIYMMTPDKDYGQLVEERIFLYKPSFLGNDFEVWGVDKVLEKWGIKRIDQVVDMLGLQGDAVDNIPGIKGVGDKTAKKLLDEYDTVENLVANVHSLTGKLKESVSQQTANALLSKELAKIKIDCPVTFDESTLKVQTFDEPKLVELLDELEFRTIKKKLFGEDKTAEKPTKNTKTPPPATDLFGQPLPNQPNKPANNTTNSEEEDEDSEKQIVPIKYKTFDTTVKHYHLIDTPALRQSLAAHLAVQPSFAFDTETTGLDALTAELVGISFAYYPNEAYYVPLPDNRQEVLEILALFKPILEDEKIEKIGQNIKYDKALLENYGVFIKGKNFDTMLAHYLLEPDMRHNMDVLAENYLNYTPISIETLIGKKGKNQLNMRDVPVAKVKDYAAEDADITFQLKQHLESAMKQRDGLEQLFHTVEMPLVEVLAKMERTGIALDVPALQNYSKELEKEIKELEQKIYQQAGVVFNIASPKQLGEVLFDKLKLGKDNKKTKTGQYATGEEVLQDLANDNEIVRNILEIRQLQKLKSTYVDALPEMVSSQDGRVHTSYNQAVAATGRLSSNNPNLQNIPIKTEKGREIRKAFIAQSPDTQLFSADYSQIELRIMASFSQDATMIEAFRQGKDIHAATAAKIFKVPVEQVDKDMRRKAKTANFGIIYGVSAFGLAQQLNIPRKEAGELINAYFAEFPAIRAYMDKIIEFAREHEYVETILKRRRYLRDINSRNQVQRGFAERNAINAPIQGSAADIIKVAMIRIHDWLQTAQLKSKLLLQVHDELVFEVHQDELEIVQKEVVAIMQNAVTLDVPMEVGVGVGKNWLEAH